MIVTKIVKVNFSIVFNEFLILSLILFFVIIFIEKLLI